MCKFKSHLNRLDNLYLAIKSRAIFIVLVALTNIMLQCVLVSSADAQGYTVSLNFTDDSIAKSINTEGNESSFAWQIGRLKLNKKGTGNRSFAFLVQEKEGDRITARSPDKYTGPFNQSVFNDNTYPHFKGNEQLFPPISGQSFKFGRWYLSRRYKEQGLACDVTRCYSVGFVPDVSGITNMQPGRIFKTVFKLFNYECRSFENCAAASTHELSITISRQGISHVWKSGVALNAAKDSAVFTYDPANNSYPTITADLNVLKPRRLYFKAEQGDYRNGQRISNPTSKSVAQEGGDAYTKVPAGFSRPDTRVYGEGWSNGSGRFLTGVWFFDQKNHKVAFSPDPVRIRENVKPGETLESRVTLKFSEGSYSTTLKAQVSRNKLKLSIENTSATEVNEGGSAMFRISSDDNPSGTGIQNIEIRPTVSGHNYLVSTWGAKDVNKSLTVSDLTFTQTGGSGPYSTVYLVPTLDQGNAYGGDGSITLALVAESTDNYEIVSGKGSASVTVKDTTTAPKIQFDDNSLTKSVGEGDTAELTISTTGRIAQNATVVYTINTDSPYTAAEVDYSDSGNGMVIIDSATGTGTIRIAITSDSDNTEEDETFQVVLSNDTMGTESLVLELVDNKKSSVITISKGPIEPQIRMSASDSPVSEGGLINFTIKISSRQSEKVTIPMKVILEGSSKNTVFWAPSVAVIPADADQTTYTIATIDNSEDTGDVTVRVSMYDVSGYDVIQTPLGIAVTDNDTDGLNPATTYSVAGEAIRSIIMGSSGTSPTEPKTPIFESPMPVVSISAVNSIIEVGSAAEFLIVSNDVVESDLSIKVKLNGRVGLIGGGNARTAIIPAGQSSATLSVNTQDNGIAEQDAILTATLLEDSKYRVSNGNSAFVTVSDEVDRDLRRQGLSEANRTVLPRVLTAMRTVSMNTTSEHLAMAMNGEAQSGISLGGRDSIDDLVMTGGKTLNGDWEGIRSEIGNSSFVLNLFPEEEYQSPATIWGVSEVGGLPESSSSSSQSFHGDLFSGQVGITARLGNGFVAGLSTDLSESEVKYMNGSTSHGGISYSAKMTGFNPYLGYESPDGDSRFQAVAGYGMGEIGLHQEDYAIEYLDSSFVSARLGGLQQLYLGSMNFSGDAWAIRQTVDSNDGFIPGFQSNASHFRFSAEGRQQYLLANFGTFTPSAEAAIRGGTLDRDSVLGFEVAVGFDLSNESGIAISGSGRTFMSPDVPATQWKMGTKLTYDHGSDGIGLQLAIEPVWGGLDAGISNSFQQDYPLIREISLNSDKPQNEVRLDSEMSYGISIGEGSHLLKPYIGYSTENFQQHEFQVGSGFNLNQTLQVELVGKRISSENTLPEENFKLNGTLNW